MTLTTMQGYLSLFAILVVILLVNPSFYNNMYNNVLGRMFLIIIMIFFAMNNITLGLLVTLIIIIGTNMNFTEGLTGMDLSALKMKPSIGQIQVNTRSESKKKKNSSKDGIDRMTLDETLKPKQSEQIYVSKENFTSVDVSAADSDDLNSNTSMFSSPYSSA
jgi:hypothetical protein